MYAATALDGTPNYCRMVAKASLFKSGESLGDRLELDLLDILSREAIARALTQSLERKTIGPSS